MSKIVTLDKINKWIPKKYKEFIQEVDEDSEVWEVILKDGYSSVDGETMWVYGKHHYYGDYYPVTQKDIKDDLQLWLYQVEKC